jgi:hypothetical protein
MHSASLFFSISLGTWEKMDTKNLMCAVCSPLPPRPQMCGQYGEHLYQLWGRNLGEIMPVVDPAICSMPLWRVKPQTSSQGMSVTAGSTPAILISKVYYIYPYSSFCRTAFCSKMCLYSSSWADSQHKKVMVLALLLQVFKLCSGHSHIQTSLPG